MNFKLSAFEYAYAVGHPPTQALLAVDERTKTFHGIYGIRENGDVYFGFDPTLGVLDHVTRLRNVFKALDRGLLEDANFALFHMTQDVAMCIHQYEPVSATDMPALGNARVYRTFQYSNHSMATAVLNTNANASLIRLDNLMHLNSQYTPLQPTSLQGLVYVYADPKQPTYERANLIQNSRGGMFLTNTLEFGPEVTGLDYTQAWRLLDNLTEDLPHGTSQIKVAQDIRFLARLCPAEPRKLQKRDFSKLYRLRPITEVNSLVVVERDKLLTAITSNYNSTLANFNGIIDGVLDNSATHLIKATKYQQPQDYDYIRMH